MPRQRHGVRLPYEIFLRAHASLRDAQDARGVFTFRLALQAGRPRSLAL